MNKWKKLIKVIGLYGDTEEGKSLSLYQRINILTWKVQLGIKFSGKGGNKESNKKNPPLSRHPFPGIKPQVKTAQAVSPTFYKGGGRGIYTEFTRLIFGLIVFSAAFFCLALPTFAETAGGAAFLKIPVGARPASLGNAFTALADDAGALFWNPAGLSRMKSNEIFTSHAQLYLDTRLDNIGYAQPISGVGVVAVGAIYLTQGKLQGRGGDRAKSSAFVASDIAASIGFSRRIRPGLGLGAAIKYIRQSIADVSASGFGADIGLAFDPAHSKWRFGLAGSNLGPAMKFSKDSYGLPMSVSAGVGYRVLDSLMTACDVKFRPNDGKLSAGLGAELAVIPQVVLRAGYSQSSLSPQTAGSIPQGLGAGLGLSLARYRVDYSFVPMGELGSVQGLTLAIRFGENAPPQTSGRAQRHASKSARRLPASGLARAGQPR